MKKIFALIFLGVSLIFSGCDLFLSIETNGSVDADSYEPNDGPINATSIVLGQTYSASIDSDTDVDWFKVALKGDEVYTVETSSDFSKDDGVDTYLYLYDTDGGTELAKNDNMTIGSYSLIETTNQLGSDGTYYIKVKGTGIDNTGYYDLQVSHKDSPYYPYSLTFGTTKIAKIDSGTDVDWFGFRMTSGITYTINVNSTGGTDFDVVLGLYNAYDTDTIMTNVDENSGGSSESLTYAASSSFNALVKITGFNSSETGDYSISVSTN